MSSRTQEHIIQRDAVQQKKTQIKSALRCYMCVNNVYIVATHNVKQAMLIIQVLYWNRLSGGHTGGASGAVHQGPRPLGAHQRGPDSNFFKLISSVSHVASHSGYCREIVF